MKIINFIRRCIRAVRRRTQPIEINFIRDLDFIMKDDVVSFNDKEYQTHKNDEKYILNWVIPEIGIGSGGHTTIFRFISNLEKNGFHSRVYTFNCQAFKSDAEVTAFAHEHFSILDQNVELFYSEKEMKFAHATFATSWQTAYYVKNFDNTLVKIYFVQDFEPYFFAKGSFYELAENTYHFGLKGITAGDWLKDKLHKEYGMETESFGFSYDKQIYVAKEKKDKVPRVFFYTRPNTERRDFELGLLALNELSHRIPDLEVVFAGGNLKDYVIPFNHHSHGIITPKELSEIYSQCDICLVLSNTNLSLLPLEVMASNSVAMCSKGDNSTWLVNEENSIMIDYNPMQIAQKMEYYIKHPEELDVIRQNGLKFAHTTDWEKEAIKVANTLNKWIKAALEENNHE